MCSWGRFAGLTVVAAAMLAVACGQQQPIHITATGLFADWPVNERFDHAVSIVRARVDQILPSRWDTVDGRRPAEVTGHVIYTDVILTAMESWKGAVRPGASLRVRLMGGTVGQDSMSAEDEASLQQDEEAYLLLVQDPGATGVWRVMHLGKYSHLADGSLSNGLTTLTPAEFVQMAQTKSGH